MTTKILEDCKTLYNITISECNNMLIINGFTLTKSKLTTMQNIAFLVGRELGIALTVPEKEEDINFIFYLENNDFIRLIESGIRTYFTVKLCNEHLVDFYKYFDKRC